MADSTAVSQFQGGMWSDSWTVAADGAGEVKVNLNALIVLPEADNMSEVKVKEVSNDEATKNQLRKVFLAIRCTRMTQRNCRVMC